MRKEHYGAVAAVLVAFVLCRLLSYRIASFFGTVTGHERAAGSALGALIGAIPFAVLAIFAAYQWRHVSVEGRRWLQILGIVGWLVAGAILGILPYSRFGADTGLAARERHAAPGLLHALDVTIVVGLALCLVGLLVVLAQGGLRRPGGAPGRDQLDRTKRTW